jgi:LysM repeat protein
MIGRKTISYFCGEMEKYGIALRFSILSLFLMGFLSPMQAQSGRMSTESYIRKYKAIAIKDMKKYKIPASITLAQGILESGSGNSRLARRANNHFGIKCHDGWHGKKIRVTDDARRECFRKYKSAEDSYRDHSRFLTERSHYGFLFNYPITDYKKWAYGLKKAGYATNPKYPQLLIHLIEKYHLDQYDHASGKTTRNNRQKDKPYTEPNLSNFPPAGKSLYGRNAYTNNGRRLIVVKAGDTYNKIAAEFEISPKRLMRINESKAHPILYPGDFIYLKTKRGIAQRSYRYHLVKKGESLWEIAQLYGVRLHRLRRLNNLPKKYQPAAGTKLKVR